MDNHQLQIKMPEDFEKYKYAKISSYLVYNDGKIGKMDNSNIKYHSGEGGRRTTQSTLNDDTVVGMKVMISIIVKKKDYDDAITGGTDPSNLSKPSEPEPIMYQDGMIYVDHSK